MRLTFTNTSVETITAYTSSGPSSLTWTFAGSDVCVDSDCIVDMCGFVVGTYEPPLRLPTAPFTATSSLPASTPKPTASLSPPPASFPPPPHPTTSLSATLAALPPAISPSTTTVLPTPPPPPTALTSSTTLPAAAICPHRVPPSPPPGTVTVEYVTSLATFSGLDLTSLSNLTFSAEFNASFSSQMAAAAGVASADVILSSIAAGSVTVTSSVYFPSTTTSTPSAFSTTLLSDTASVFAAFGDSYGTISVSLLSSGTASASRPSSPPPPIVSLSGDATATIYGTGNTSTTCFIVAAPPGVKAINVSTISGPSSEAWLFNGTELCDPAQCQLKLCGFSLGIYVLQGVITFVDVDASTSTVIATVEVYDPPPPPSPATTFAATAPPPPPLPPPPLPSPAKPLPTTSTSSSSTSPSPNPAPPSWPGADYVELLQRDVYTDAGAWAFDEFSTRYVAVTTVGLEQVQSCLAEGCITDPETPFLVIYSATDASGNAAESVTRRVAVLAFCAVPSYLCADAGAGRTCAACELAEEGSDAGAPMSCACELFFSADLVTPEPVNVEVYTPPVDTDPPVLTLLGDGQRAVTKESGVAVMIHTLTEGSAWADPGVTVSDNVDGDTTAEARVMSFGVAAMDTTAAREDPYVVTYTVADAAGNSAEVHRWIYVINECVGAGEDGDDKWECQEGTEGDDFTSDSMEAAHPTLTLRGPASVQIVQGSVYMTCP
ncbi:hypothetical protein CYMTET_44943 [Cymbomonas tetramitiformis]|uniref:Pesticidal crystal protein Cry22Aa Ig-like domain-containing protein n=1 Tax=Cymbomonas tetramitiformis TaxID=36881 RepID=A0AAE0C0F1_9CHLO|nr:hypothetical protein CYMTET_44943 [Cymbomonas tetramitiformis]